MAYRELVDERGDTWTVWDTYPGLAHHVAMPSLQHGWLTFRCGDRLCRLVPAPIGWADEPDDRLRALLDAATPVQSSTELEDPEEPLSPGAG